MTFLRNSKILILIAVVVLTMAVFAGCSKKDSSIDTNTSTNENNQTDNANNELKGNITIAGSTSVTPTAEKIAEAFMQENPNVKIEVQGVGSSAGVKAANEGAADIGMASRDLKTKEKEWGLTEHIIAYDGIAVVVHPSNNVSDLTKEQVAKIFTGEIKNWSEVGGDNQDIIVVSREAGSGTRGAFEEIMGIEGKVREDALIAEGNGAVRANIAKKNYGIGYISLSYLNDEVKGIKVNGVEPTVENIKAKTYPVYRPFLMLTKGEMNEVVKAYMDYVFSSKGQKIVEENGCITVE